MESRKHPDGPETFVENYRRALDDSGLRGALATATGKALDSRRQAVADVGEGDWERLRSRARAIKEHTVEHLDFYLAQLADKVERGGGHVFWAQTAEDARRYITELAARKGCGVAVKSKSMMTEEIGLNAALEAAGVEAVETDLGEYIVQLAGERPSHINMPAIHKTRGDVADLFTAKLGVERDDDIARMAGLARRVLRRRFAEAGMGITGVNYAVAETGTLVLVENEGNIRLTNSLPRVHVALMGIEKVIPRLEDVDVFLRLLSRSASGQQLCSYLSFLTGVKTSPSEEGPEEFHLVILDNGRTGMLANPHLRESLFCIRCGACLNVCPVYQKIGGHAYGWVYPGPIGAVLTPQMVGRERAAALPFASSLCGACRDVCPVKINIPDMLLRLRHEIKEGVRKSPPRAATRPAHHRLVTDDEADDEAEDELYVAPLRHRAADFVERALFMLWAAAMKTPFRYRAASRVARVAQSLFGRRNKDAARVLRVPRWAASRDLPPFAARPFRERWPELSKDAEEYRAAKIALPGDRPTRDGKGPAAARRG
ncbi:MAG TPA: LutB/LldF family L-lactate oxidation iron-sulfur protein [Pyrinomonadaceae bacterium]|nr:LutB/LldF family L-lactate oxidation iron-sulfur protein [Pyrinomonadaceae bacterium]